jgi:predicted lipoprotein with Yx(FWY)xxD motif
LKPSRFISASVFTLGALLCLSAPVLAAQTAPAAANSASDLPAGIRIGMANVSRGGMDSNARNANTATIVFADGAGSPLYALAGNAQCAGACLEKWHPAIAAQDAVANKDWTLVGARQWAFQGRPLYTPVNGKPIDTPFTTPDYNQLPFRDSGTPTLDIKDDGADGMKVLTVTPKSWIKTPFAIGIAEYRLAPGQVLTTGITNANPLGQALYAFSGTPAQEQALGEYFAPVNASGLSVPIGDFTIRERPDATRQWAYRGAPLYTCSCDVSAGDVNGDGAAPGIKAAVVVRYPTPSQIKIKKDVLTVGRMVEASTGMTIYFRDRALEKYIPDNSRPPQGTMDPGIGASLGTKHCDAKCEKEWHPLLASANAQAHGYWSVYYRPDGKHQWAYKNSALYTHATEKPGSLDGNEQYMIQFEDGYGHEALPREYGMGLMWRAVTP